MNREADWFLVADRGLLKVYVQDSETHSLHIVEEMRVEEAHGRYADEFTDQAGAFPNGGTAGRGNSIAERKHLEAENEMRSFRKIADKIDTVVRQIPGRHWNFAAPQEINGAILDGLPGDIRQGLRKNLGKDLVNVPTNQVLEHFH